MATDIKNISERLEATLDPFLNEAITFGEYSSGDFEFILSIANDIVGGDPEVLVAPNGIEEADKEGTVRFALRSTCSCKDCAAFRKSYLPVVGSTLLRAVRNYVLQRAEYLKAKSACDSKSLH